MIFRLTHLTNLLFNTGRDTGVNYAATATELKCALLFATKLFELLRSCLACLLSPFDSIPSKPLRAHMYLLYIVFFNITLYGKTKTKCITPLYKIFIKPFCHILFYFANWKSPCIHIVWVFITDPIHFLP